MRSFNLSGVPRGLQTQQNAKRKEPTVESGVGNPPAEGHSPGDFAAAHSLVVSGQNRLKGRSQHFVQGCKETVGEDKKDRDRVRYIQTGSCHQGISQSKDTQHFLLLNVAGGRKCSTLRFGLRTRPKIIGRPEGCTLHSSVFI